MLIKLYEKNNNPKDLEKIIQTLEAVSYTHLTLPTT